MSANRKLGRGLDALLRKSEPAPEPDPLLGIREVATDSIRLNEDQPRKSFDEEKIDELSRSIATHGILQPLVVLDEGSGVLRLVAGERRLRAARKLGLSTVPVVVRKVDRSKLLDLAVVENIQREDLNPIELAIAFHAIKERNHWTQEELASSLGKKRSTIANILRYLDLHDSIRESLVKGELSEGHAKVLLSLPTTEQQLDFFRQIQEWNLSVRDLEDRIHALLATRAAGGPEDDSAGKSTRGPQASRRRKTANADPHIAALEHELSTSLATKVQIKQGRAGRGRVVIEFYAEEQFQRLRELLARAK